MPDPVIAQKAPYAVDVAAGKSYFWCTCGKSSKQPFCDGSHQGTEFAPLPHRAEAAATVYFCGCKLTQSPPFCDGSHNRL